jgi:cytoskeletal protein CcmA (bactofilin family)
MNHSNKYLSAGWRGLAALVVVASPAFATTANAAAFDFSGGAVAGCPLSGVTYTCPPSISTATDTIAVASGYILTITGSGELVVGTATLGVDSGFNGSLTAMATIALGAGADMKGDLTAGTTAALGANAYLEGNLTASTTVALGAGAHVHGNVESTTTFVTMGANAAITGNLTAAGAATLGAAASVCLNVNSVTATLGADAYVSGNVQATTVTLGADAYVNGSLEAVTVTLGADACYGSLAATTTLTIGADAGQCTLPRPATLCSIDTECDWVPDEVDPCPDDYYGNVRSDGTCSEPEEYCYWVLVDEPTLGPNEAYFEREFAQVSMYGMAVTGIRTASMAASDKEQEQYEEICYVIDEDYEDEYYDEEEDDDNEDCE